MKLRNVIILLLLSFRLPAQCDLNGILLELQATTNLSGLLVGQANCITSATISSPLTLTGSTISITSGNLTAGSSKVSIGGTGTGALLGSGASVDVVPANILLSTLGGAMNLNQLSTTGAITGQVVKYNGTSWAVGSDNTGSGVTSIGYVAPAAGLAISGTNPVTSTGTWTYTLADDLAALEGLSGTGFGVRTGASTWTNRSITSGTGISISNGDGVASNPQVINTAPDQTVTLTAGTGISTSGTYPNFTIASTITQYTDELAQDAVGNILTDGSIIDFTYNDAGNSITATVINNSIGNAQIRQGVARSVIGVTGNATANVADIQGTTDQVLRVSSGGTALAFGQVATGGIADDAVTYAKIQNVVANNVVLGNIAGSGGIVTELTVANLYTLLGMSGTAGRNAFWSGTNTLSNSANWLWDNTNGRVTIIPQTAGLGGGAAALNINPPGAGTLSSMEGVRVWGNVAGTLSTVFSNTNTAATSHSLVNIASGSDAAGDAFLQLQIAGGSGVTASIGLDNSDGNKLKISHNAVTPGATVDNGIIITSGTPALVGINKDAPVYPLDVNGTSRSLQILETGNLWSSGNISFSSGAGTGPVLTEVIGSGNWFKLTFTTGTSPTAGGVIFTATYPRAFPSATFPVFCARNDKAAADITKMHINADGPTTCAVKNANGALQASTQYVLVVNFGGY